MRDLLMVAPYNDEAESVFLQFRHELLQPLNKDYLDWANSNLETYVAKIHEWKATAGFAEEHHKVARDTRRQYWKAYRDKVDNK